MTVMGHDRSVFRPLPILALAAFSAVALATPVEVTLADTPTRSLWITDGWPKTLEEGRVLGGAGSVTTLDVPPGYREPYLVVHAPEENRMAVIDVRGVSHYSTGAEDRRYLAKVRIEAGAGEASLEDPSRRHPIALMSGVGVAIGVAPGPVTLVAGDLRGEATLSLETALPVPTVRATARSLVRRDDGPGIAVFVAIGAALLASGIAIATALRAAKTAKPPEAP